MEPGSPSESIGAAPRLPLACANHPATEALTFCQRCERPICADCMIEAPVGYQCPACVQASARRTGQGRLPFGGKIVANPQTTSTVLIGINVAVWVAILLTGVGASQLVDLLALHPQGICVSLGTPGSYYPEADAAGCASLGAAAMWYPGVLSGAVWQLITSGFVHLQIWHLAGNMLSLWFVGPPLERILGRARFLTLYLVSLLAGSVAVVWLSDPRTTTLGASGAIFGLLGAMLVLAYRTKSDVGWIWKWIGLNVVITVLGIGFISWQGHLGGFLGGLAVTAALAFTPGPRPRRSKTQVALVGGIVLALVALTLAAAFVR